MDKIKCNLAHIPAGSETRMVLKVIRWSFFHENVYGKIPSCFVCGDVSRILCASSTFRRFMEMISSSAIWNKNWKFCNRVVPLGKRSYISLPSCLNLLATVRVRGALSCMVLKVFSVFPRVCLYLYCAWFSIFSRTSFSFRPVAPKNKWEKFVEMLRFVNCVVSWSENFWKWKFRKILLEEKIFVLIAVSILGHDRFPFLFKITPFARFLTN